MRDNDGISLDDTIEIDGEVVSARDLRNAFAEAVRQGVKEGFKPLKGLTYTMERSAMLTRYMIAILNATRYGISSKPMDVSEIVPVDLSVEHNATGGRGYAPRNKNCEEMRLLNKEEDTEDGLQQALNDMDTHDRRIEAVCRNLFEAIEGKYCSRRQLK